MGIILGSTHVALLILGCRYLGLGGSVLILSWVDLCDTGNMTRSLGHPPIGAVGRGADPASHLAGPHRLEPDQVGCAESLTSVHPHCLCHPSHK